MNESGLHKAWVKNTIFLNTIVRSLLILLDPDKLFRVPQISDEKYDLYECNCKIFVNTREIHLYQF